MQYTSALATWTAGYDAMQIAHLENMLAKREAFLVEMIATGNADMIQLATKRRDRAAARLANYELG